MALARSAAGLLPACAPAPAASYSSASFADVAINFPGPPANLTTANVDGFPVLNFNDFTNVTLTPRLICVAVPAREFLPQLVWAMARDVQVNPLPST
jgi:hypothetical protein